jgi:hypothetical protein
MVWLQGRLVIYANVVICITASMQPDHAQIQLPTTTAATTTATVGLETAPSTTAAPFAGSNPNPIQGIWGRSKTDLERRRPGQGLGLALNTIRKQSRIKLSESIETLHHQISDNLSTPLRSASAVLSSSDFLMHGRGGSTATATAQATAPKAKKERRPNNSGFYYGLTDDVFFPPKQNEEPRQGQENSNSPRAQNENRAGGAITRNSMPSQPNRINDQNPASPPKSLTDIMGETLLELREMREDIYGLREEMQYLKEEFKLQKRYASGYTNTDDDDDVDENDNGGLRVDQYEYPMPSIQDEHQKRIERIKRQAEFEAIGNDVEKWAHKLLFEEDGEKDGWKEVKCNKMVRKKFNENGQTTCYMKVS